MTFYISPRPTQSIQATRLKNSKKQRDLHDHKVEELKNKLKNVEFKRLQMAKTQHNQGNIFIPASVLPHQLLENNVKQVPTSFLYQLGQLFAPIKLPNAFLKSPNGTQSMSISESSITETLKSTEH